MMLINIADESSIEKTQCIAPVLEYVYSYSTVWAVGVAD